MKFLNCLVLSVLLASAAFAAEPTPEEIRVQNQYVEYRLTQGEIYKIHTKMGDGVTTIQFPSKISEIAGKNISIDGKGTDFQIAAQPGSYYFSVSALRPGATGTLTVTYNRQLYILYLIQSDKEAYASVVFSRNSGSRSFTNNIVNQTPKVTPARLVSLIDLAKKYEVLKDTYPETIAGAEQARFRNRYRCGKYDIHLDEAIRFDQEDTVIFKLRLVNLTAEEIKYDKHSFSAHAGENIHYMSVSDASGIMPPKSQTFAWFGITSTPRGGRNNLRADNDWLIALTTQEMHLDNLQSVESEVTRKQRLAAEQQAIREKQDKDAAEKLQAADKLMEELISAKAEMEKSLAELKAQMEAEPPAAVETGTEPSGIEKIHAETMASMLEMQHQTRESISRMKAETEEAIRRMQSRTASGKEGE